LSFRAFQAEGAVKELSSLTFRKLELLNCLHFPVAATGINKESVSLWCG